MIFAILYNDNIVYLFTMTIGDYMSEISKTSEIILRPDSKGRIALGDIARNVSSYRVTIEDSGKIILEPYAEIPLSSKWIFDDKELFEKVSQEIKSKNDKIESA